MSSWNYFSDQRLLKSGPRTKNIQFPFDITLYIKMSVRVCLCECVCVGVFFVCKLFFSLHFDAWKTLFCIFFFFFLLLLLRYVKFFSHIRRKKSSNKVQLTHGGSTAFHSFFFFFYFKKFLFCFRISKGNTDRGNRYLCDASFIVSFCLFISFIFFLLVSMKEKEETKRLKRFQSAATAPFRFQRRHQSDCIRVHAI